MRLFTLGGLKLEPDLTDPQPLLVLAFVALEGKRSRGELKELFWPHQPDKTKRSKSLSDVVRRLKGADPRLLEPGRGALSSHLTSYVGVDALDFQAAVGDKRYEEAVELYGGTFLGGLERKRLRLGEEVREWLEGKRSELQEGFVRVLLALADEHVRRGDPAAARGRVRQALALPEGVAPPSVQALARMKALLLAAGFGGEAEGVGEKARHLYGSPSLRLPSLTPWQGVGLQTGSLPIGADPSFIGRETELRELAEHFGTATRLVTVTGLAGIGKTALARAFAQQAFPYFDGAYVVSLSPAPDATPPDLWQRLAEALGVTGSAEGLTELLREKALLLIFDNFDNTETHAASRAVIAALLRDCSRLGILVTSRESLGLEGEHVVRLGGLDLPREATTLSELHRTDAGRLLLAEARRRAFAPRDEDAPALAELCRQTAGVPLALKLAADGLPSLPLDALVTLPGTRLRSPGSALGAVAAAFDVSLERLEPEARTLFSRLGVFEGGFGFGAAAAVVGARPETLKRLVNASLLEFGGRRYGLHPLIGRYLGERFEVPDALKAKHARYFLDALGAVVSDDPREKDRAVETLREDVGNLVAAWNWAVSQDEAALLQTRLPALQRLCDGLSQARVGLELVDKALLVHAAHTAAPHLSASRAWFLLRLGRYQEAVTQATSALPMLSGALAGACAARETCFNALGAAHDALGGFTEARRAFEASLRLAQTGSGEAATAMTNLAVNAINRGAYGDARTHLTEASALFSAQAKRGKLVWCAYVGGWLALETGELPRARVALEEALTEAQKLDLTHWALLCKLKRAHLFALEGYVERAKRLGYEVLRDVQAQKFGKEARVHATLGAICLSEEPVAALAHYSASLRMRRSTRSEPLMLQSLVGILSALSVLEPLPIGAPLFTFCARSVPKMFYVDRRNFQDINVQGLAPGATDPAWQTLSTSEVASLVLSLLEEAGML